MPGAIGGWVEITDAKKKSLPANVPFPAGIKESLKSAKNENIEIKQVDSDEKKEEPTAEKTKNLEQNKQQLNETPQGNGK